MTVPARMAFASVGAANAVLAVTVAQGLSPGRTYAGASTLAAVGMLAASLSLLAAGVVVRPRTLSTLSLLAGWLWVMPVWSAWSSGPAVVASAAAALAAFVFPAVLHLVLAFPRGRVGGRALRLVVSIAWACAAMSALLLALFRDPFFDVNCWSNCSDNSFLIANHPDLARTVGELASTATIVLSCALLAACSWRLARSAVHERRLLAPVAAAGSLFGAGALAHELVLWRTEPEDPTTSTFLAIFLVISAAAVLLAAGLVGPHVREWVARRTLHRLLAQLGNAPAPGALESALQAALRDDSLATEFWLRDAGRFADARGHPIVDEQQRDTRASVTVRRGDETVAVIRHDPAVMGRVAPEIGPAVRLALENERMRVELMAQLDELTASRRQFIEIGDEERRRIERNLHDGVQQDLLALSSELRATRAATRQPATEGVLDEAIRKTHVALDDLRELAHGVFPAILSDAGLAAAIESLADRAAVTVVPGALTDERFPAVVETTAYLAAASAIERAEVLRSVETVHINVHRELDTLIVEVHDERADEHSQPPGFANEVEERVRALGGRIEVGRADGLATVVRAVIPCA